MSSALDETNMFRWIELCQIQVRVDPGEQMDFQN